ncbi:MAG: S-methyl-5-thioribose-1-phosphate isomerase [Planctomycetes bacterium]|nr:S-methyl-5-thioribose-1-phosphate isomerase [Planctomycetota bacterium]MBI3834376.1 S-methyl-5-thioribose-1-phosphate isomerase [Planctomycetota bacterium]
MSLANLPRTIEWIGELDGFVRMIDQTKLPESLEFIACRDVACMWHAIKRLIVRGAPAIGIAAAMGAVLAVREETLSAERLLSKLDETSRYLASSRPTAVNLTWALTRMKQKARASAGEGAKAICTRLLDEAKQIRDEDEAACRAIGQNGLSLIKDGAQILTHCNAGSLATAYYGTALAPIYTAHEASRRVTVFADETRPLLQGARLTAWELQRAGVEVRVLCDGAAASLLQRGEIDLIITGADRIAANGDSANKIGTYGLAVLAKAHKVPFYVAAPSSTFDLSIPSGQSIPIEYRDEHEVRSGFGRATVPVGVPCLNPAFDVTPAQLITGIITERGIIRPVARDGIAGLLLTLTTANRTRLGR